MMSMCAMVNDNLGLILVTPLRSVKDEYFKAAAASDRASGAEELSSLPSRAERTHSFSLTGVVASAYEKATRYRLCTFCYGHGESQ
jgi:hypothetical protein